MSFCTMHVIRRALLLSAIATLAATSALAATVTISSPAPSQTVGSPVKVVASATSSSPVKLLQIYLDGTKVYQIAAATLNTSVPAAAGTHRLTVQAYDSTNYIFKSTIYFSVGGTTATSPAPPAPSGALTFSNIDQMTGWLACDACAGPNGQNATNTHIMTENVASPSMDGRSAQFYLAGTTPYPTALWWKQLGAQPSTSHFTYDLWFYIKNPAAAQALEFDVNQTINGYQFIFGTQCNARGDHAWDVWDYYQHWVSTGVPCSAPTAYTWHHLIWQFERAGTKMHFISVTLDGKTSYVNHYHTPKPKTTPELNVAFQMDGTGSYTPYNVWLDKVTLRAW